MAVQPGTDHPTVDPVVGKMTHQLVAHGQPCTHTLGLQLGDFQTQQLVKNNQLLKHLLEPDHKLVFEHGQTGFETLVRHKLPNI
jgi:hypothetical protein